jgi:hypothetical protein
MLLLTLTPCKHQWIYKSRGYDHPCRSCYSQSQYDSRLWVPCFYSTWILCVDKLLAVASTWILWILWRAVAAGGRSMSSWPQLIFLWLNSITFSPLGVLNGVTVLHEEWHNNSGTYDDEEQHRSCQVGNGQHASRRDTHADTQTMLQTR